MITQHGPRCDVCGAYILPGCSESINPFSVVGIEQTLCCHDNCKPAVLAMQEKKTYEVLPDGPLRTFYEENKDRIVKQEGE